MEGNCDMKGENILIVDADDNSVSLLSPLLEQLGYKFRIASDPKKALTLLKNEPFSVVIADGSLFQTRQIVKIRDVHPDICFIFTGHSLEEFRHHINPGLSDFLSKPIVPKEAEFRLKRITVERDARFRNQEAERELQTARDELERKRRELELSEEDLEGIKHLYKEIGNELHTTSEKLRRANDQLELLATTDGLTEIYNHRYFMDQIDEKFEEAKKQSAPLSLLMIDIDHFKAFNDNHGHMTGDLVLKEVAQILKTNCRRPDIVARYGGEEFAIILLETDSHQAEKMAEKIRIAVESYHLPEDKEARRVTVSIGIGTTGDGIQSPDHLISSADKALYRAKAEGRNRVAFRGKTQPTPGMEWFSRF